MKNNEKTMENHHKMPGQGSKVAAGAGQGQIALERGQGRQDQDPRVQRHWLPLKRHLAMAWFFMVFHGFFKELDFKELEIHRYSLMDIHQ